MHCGVFSINTAALSKLYIIVLCSFYNIVYYIFITIVIALYNCLISIRIIPTCYKFELNSPRANHKLKIKLRQFFSSNGEAEQIQFSRNKLYAYPFLFNLVLWL